MSPQTVARIGSASPQKQSLLMRLPQELRNQIYAFLFSSTRFLSGKRTVARIDSRIFAPAQHGLAILLSCRQAYNEIGKTWLGRVLFCFECPTAMLNKLCKIRVEIRSAIKHVRVSGTPLMIDFDLFDVYYRTSQVLKLLPGLKLDILTVLGPKSAQVSYDTLNLLVKHSDGWKELHYISHNSALIAYKPTWLLWDPFPEKGRYMREPQPGGWQRNLEHRDGPDSAAPVTIYRSTNQHGSEPITSTSAWVKFTQALAPDQDLEDFQNGEYPQLMAPGELEKEMLVAP